MPLKLDCSLLACLILGFSQNALLRTTCELRDCSLVYPTISSTVQQEYKGLYNNYMVPPILIDTPGVSSSQCTSRKYPTNATLVVDLKLLQLCGRTFLMADGGPEEMLGA